ncbi:flagellar protein FlgJ [Pseudoduganella lurida]|uniref:Flagellar protein FlgJ n=1 Tax=Pseudoduganella lurida TaxID=1036180 RepID=A0A562RFD0_9BURK|nr:glucosaminidase domain-containing protein [Pseudoduganella lurida]TWI67603.1 flagellar protein FlgJ [Pseudoduganella lurida]
MSRPDFTFATPPTAATAATASNMTAARPALPAGFGGGAAAGGFASAFNQVQADVANFIAAGGSVGSAGAGLTADGAALRARLSATALGGPAADGAIDGGIDGSTIDGSMINGSTAQQQEFLAAIRPYAAQAAEKLGVSPDIVAAHAALESGWGQRPLRQGGADTNNLFGIKAGSGWQGDVAANTTTEYEHGAAVRKVEKFRSYPDQASAFRDYAELLTANPRYQSALNAGNDAHAFASGLARGGYATDPAYAQKLAKLAAKIARSE